MASRKPAASIARYGQVPGVRVTNDATRRRLRYRPDTATASQRTPGHTDASTAGGPPPGLRHQLRAPGETDLAISRPIVVITCIIASSESWGPYQRPHPWHSRAGGGAVHSINRWC